MCVCNHVYNLTWLMTSFLLQWPGKSAGAHSYSLSCPNKEGRKERTLILFHAYTKEVCTLTLFFTHPASITLARKSAGLHSFLPIIRGMMSLIACNFASTELSGHWERLEVWFILRTTLSKLHISADVCQPFCFIINSLGTVWTSKYFTDHVQTNAWTLMVNFFRPVPTTAWMKMLMRAKKKENWSASKCTYCMKG